MTRSYAARATRITQPLRIARPPRDPGIEPLGFACFRLVWTTEGFVAARVQRSANAMFVLATAPRGQRYG